MDFTAGKDQEVLGEESTIIHGQREALLELLREDIQKLVDERQRAAQRHRAEIEARRAVEREKKASKESSEIMQDLARAYAKIPKKSVLSANKKKLSLYL